MPVIIESDEEKVIIRTVEKSIDMMVKYKEKTESAGGSEVLKLKPENNLTMETL